MATTTQPKLERYESWLFAIVDRLSIRSWFTVWFGTVGVSAVIYWLLTGNGSHGISQSTSSGSISFLDSVYFSFVTITTLGYGDIAPHGFARVFAAVEATLGVFVIGALVTKLLSRSTEKLILENNELAVEERTARILSNVQFLLSEFQSVAVQAVADEPARVRETRRLDNGVWTLTHVFRAIDEVMQSQRQIDATTMTIILSSMRNTLEAYLESRQRMSRHRSMDLPSEYHLSKALRAICDRCTQGYPLEVQEAARQVGELATSTLVQPASHGQPR